MDTNLSRKEQVRSGSFSYRDGRLYFTGRFERRLFFVGTIIMMFWGLLVKVGIL